MELIHYTRKNQLFVLNYANYHYSDKQTTLEQIREKLAAQMKTQVDDEDGRIRKAVEEAEEKRAKDDAEREQKARRMIQEADAHRAVMVSWPICIRTGNSNTLSQYEYTVD